MNYKLPTKRIDVINCSISSVKWTALGHIFKNPKMQILTPVFFYFYSLNMLK